MDSLSHRSRLRRLIIIDDHSTDGTWEIIHCAAGLYPIEVQRASADEGRSFAERRSEAFGQAIEASRSRFDWIICLESDEYVYLEHENSVGAYLERFANADAITLHWSIFGSNNHVVPSAWRPLLPIRVARRLISPITSWASCSSVPV
ncbi:glycosyltransferase family 2 protein [Asaia prunellae]|uniref:glycosyltransferase family 2 protein n=1 Tax=Asaia prunellae TaxID=610245 RepID=UPI000471DE4C|nr:glycosyltransferase family 2 protein [Asaia prunellae]